MRANAEEPVLGKEIEDQITQIKADLQQVVHAAANEDADHQKQNEEMQRIGCLGQEYNLQDCL